jgi:phosphoribosyl-ATP pyrophosphohydrolase/phosphoribosyl-AMP cyclohydrolase
VLDLDRVNFEKGNGLVTVVAQDARSGAVLMVAHADREALERTAATGEMHYRSRTRGLWRKGATSGNTQRVVSLALDCDGDAVLARVEPAGPACHTGTVSCFGADALAADVLGALDATIARRAAGEGAGTTRAEASEAANAGPGTAESGTAGPAAGRATSGPGAPPRVQDGAAAASAHHLSNASATEPSPLRPRPSYTQRLLGDRNLRLKKLGEESAELVTACADADAARAAEEGADLIYHTLVALRAVGVTLGDVRRVLTARGAPGG